MYSRRWVAAGVTGAALSAAFTCFSSCSWGSDPRAPSLARAARATRPSGPSFAPQTPRAAQQDPPPFSPEVEEFVATYLKTGGDKLTSWVHGDKVSPPDEALRAFKTTEGLTIDLVASEPVIRQPIDLHFDDRGRLWVVQYIK